MAPRALVERLAAWQRTGEEHRVMAAQLALNEGYPGAGVVNPEDRLLEEPHRLLGDVDGDPLRVG